MFEHDDLKDFEEIYSFHLDHDYTPEQVSEWEQLLYKSNFTLRGIRVLGELARRFIARQQYECIDCEYHVVSKDNKSYCLKYKKEENNGRIIDIPYSEFECIHKKLIGQK